MDHGELQANRMLVDWADSRPGSQIGTAASNPGLRAILDPLVARLRANPSICTHVAADPSQMTFLLPWFEPLSLLCADCALITAQKMGTLDPEQFTCDHCRVLTEKLFPIHVVMGRCYLYLYLCEPCFDGAQPQDETI